MNIIARLAGSLERGIWGVHVARYFVTFSAPWARILTDAYVFRRTRTIRMRSWMVVVHKR